MRKQGKETALVRQILDYLALKGIWSWRVNAGGLLDHKTGRFVRFGPPAGHPDVIAMLRPRCPSCRAGSVLHIEAKAGEKGRLSPAQKDWQVKAEEHGITYLVARKLEDITCLFEKPKKTGASLHAEGGGVQRNRRVEYPSQVDVPRRESEPRRRFDKETECSSEKPKKTKR